MFCKRPNNSLPTAPINSPQLFLPDMDKAAIPLRDLQAWYDEDSWSFRCEPQFFNAVRLGQVDVLSWLVSVGETWTDEAGEDDDLCGDAVDRGHVHTLEWLWENGYPWQEKTDDLCERAVKHGHVDVLKWLSRNGVPWQPLEEKICFTAIQFGRTAILEWLIERGAYFTQDMCESAVYYKQWKTLNWLLRKGVQWDGMLTAWSRCRQRAECTVWVPRPVS